MVFYRTFMSRFFLLVLRVVFDVYFSTYTKPDFFNVSIVSNGRF